MNLAAFLVFLMMVIEFLLATALINWLNRDHIYIKKVNRHLNIVYWSFVGLLCMLFVSLLMFVWLLFR